MPKAVTACTSTSKAYGADVAACGRARPHRRRARRARRTRPRRPRRRRGRARRPRRSGWSGSGAARARRRRSRRAARAAISQAVQPAVGPSSGRAASIGNAGSGPEHDRARRDQGAGADGEAGAHQVRAGEGDRVGHARSRLTSTISTVAPPSACSCDITLAAVLKSRTRATAKSARARREPDRAAPAWRRRLRRARSAGRGRPRPPRGRRRSRRRERRRARQSSTDQTTTRAESGAVAGVEARVTVATATSDVAGRQQEHRGRHGQVALTVGDLVGTGPVAGDRDPDPLADAPEAPRADQRDAERHDGDPGALDAQAGAVAHQPARGRRRAGRRAARRARRRR